MPECVWACIIARIYDSTLGSDYNLNIGILAVKPTEQKYLINYYCKLRELHRTAYFNDISRCLRKHLIFFSLRRIYESSTVHKAICRTVVTKREFQ